MMPACIIADCDFSSDILKEKIVTAKKEHVCGECLEVIKPGNRYEYVFGVCEGDPFVAKTCIPCYNVRKSLIKGCYYFGDIWEMIEESMRDQLPYEEAKKADFSWLK